VGYEAGRADALSLSFELLTPDAFRDRRSGENFLFGIAYGSQITLMLIACILFLLVGRRVYGLYGLFLVGTVLMWLALNGFGYQYLWPGSPWWHNEGFHLIFLFYAL